MWSQALFPWSKTKIGLLHSLANSAPHSGPALDRPVGEDRADHVDFVAGVDLVPDRLQNLPDRGGVGVAPAQEARNGRRGSRPPDQLLPGEDADAAGAGDVAAFVREIDLLDPVPFRLRAELGLGADGNLRCRGRNPPFSAFSSP